MNKVRISIDRLKKIRKYQTEIIDLKNTINELKKKSIEGFHIILDQVEKGAVKLKTGQWNLSKQKNKKKKKKKMKKSEHSLME